jgi:hypothetical protein
LRNEAEFGGVRRKWLRERGLRRRRGGWPTWTSAAGLEACPTWLGERRGFGVEGGRRIRFSGLVVFSGEEGAEFLQGTEVVALGGIDAALETGEDVGAAVEDVAGEMGVGLAVILE